MRNNILERKIARIVTAIAEERGISECQALDFFYATDTYRQLTEPATGLQLMSDGYILDDLKMVDRAAFLGQRTSSSVDKGPRSFLS